jgi:L-histidine N-alpha-methyltransferase
MSAPRSSHEIDLAAADAVAQFVSDVRYYMTLEPRQLPSRYLYDPLGSALFDAICWLPWYAITRAEERLLRAHAREVFQRLRSVSTIVKLRTLIDGGRTGPSHLDVHLVDVSQDALARSVLTLASLEDVRIVTHEQPYEAGLAAVAQQPPDTGRTLVSFLGSNIGNFDPPAAHAFLRTIRAALAPGDALLLGVDLVKPERQLLLAYDDPLGVTAAFNRNLLVRINRELQGDFDLARFNHRAGWNEAASRVEMYLIADSPQRVSIARAQIEFEMAAGEPIWTESSYKYRPETAVTMLDAASLYVNASWVDDAAQFALFLAEVV